MLRSKTTLLCQRALLSPRPIPPRPLLPSPRHNSAVYRTAATIPSRFPPSSARLFTNSPSRLAEQQQPPPSKPQDATATSTNPPPPDQPQPQPESEPSSSADAPNPTPHRRRPRRRGLYYSLLFLLTGLSLGTIFRMTITPPPLPPPHSAEDAYLVSQIAARGSSLPIVQELSADPAWTSWDAYSGLADTETGTGTGRGKLSMVRSRITSGPMAGSNGLAYQRIFHNAGTGEVVGVVYFGPGTSGWPGVVHGGALATVLDESLGRCAILRFPARTGVTARLELAYRAPTLTNEFYVVRTRPLVASDADNVTKIDRKMWVEGTVEDEKGRVCVEAKALFVVPKGVKLSPLVEGF
ncbi:hypothetical protein F4779DRAFT_527714 [Xylariaceae sp. FL0662B]|nr:hypothetical protein F4779DRAFT_527714 [Xylariaceae sp. FL0662B]